MGPERPPIVSREAGEPDAEAIGHFLWTLWEEAGANAPGLAGATEQIIKEIADPSAVRSRLGGPERRIFIASQGDDVVGFAATRRLADTVIELAGIMVLPSLTGRGIGTPLVEAAAEQARAQGFETMTVSTETQNEAAIAFYEARGFVGSGRSVVDVEGTSVSVVELELKL